MFSFINGEALDIVGTSPRKESDDGLLLARW
jgi:hypothetical protein